MKTLSLTLLLALRNILVFAEDPQVISSSKHEFAFAGGEVLITVKYNGNGITEKILDKIFQPFFTTKPTGQGIGLGLSLSYDIVKAHGGKMKIKENQGSEFTTQLPTS